MMLVHNGKYVCALCGVQIDAPSTKRPLVFIKASGGERNLRLVMLDGKQLHACPMVPDVK